MPGCWVIFALYVVAICVDAVTEKTWIVPPPTQLALTSVSEPREIAGGAAALDAEQDSSVWPAPEPRHDQVVKPGLDGNTGDAGFGVPVPQKVSEPQPVSV